MKVAIISNKRREEIDALMKGFENEKIPVVFVNIGKLALFTQGSKTDILAKGIDFEKYDAIYLWLEPEFTQFAEPFLDILVSKGIYCQMKPESFYILSNLPFLYSVLNAKGVKISKTMILGDVSTVEAIASNLSFPIIFKMFSGYTKTQSLVIENTRGLKSAIKSVKAKPDVITIQDYIEGDILYVAVIGKQTFGMTRKWSKQKFEHEKKTLYTKISDKESEMAIKAANAIGLDIATIKMVEGKVLTVRPQIDYLKFNKVLGSNLCNVVAKYFKEVLEV